jgi:hypothetical protein
VGKGKMREIKHCEYIKTKCLRVGHKEFVDENGKTLYLCNRHYQIYTKTKLNHSTELTTGQDEV